MSVELKSSTAETERINSENSKTLQLMRRLNTLGMCFLLKLKLINSPLFPLPTLKGVASEAGGQSGGQTGVCSQVRHV